MGGALAVAAAIEDCNRPPWAVVVEGGTVAVGILLEAIGTLARSSDRIMVVSFVGASDRLVAR